MLFIVAYPASARVRPRELVRTLARRGHDVTVATLWETEADRAGLEELRAQGVRMIAAHQSKARSLWNSLRALPTNQPLQAHYSWNPTLARAVQYAVRSTQYDVIHVEHLRAARYGLHIKSRISNIQYPIPIVWDSVDCISHLFEQSSRYGRGFFPQVITRLELPRTRRYEGWLVHQFDRVLVTSPVDREALVKLHQETRRQVDKGIEGQGDVETGSPSPPLPIAVLPNGVDLDYFTPTDQPREPETLVYLGRMSYHANVAAVLYLVREIMPLVWTQRPEVRLLIVGSDPPRAIRALATDGGRRSAVGGRVFVTYTVPDVRPYLARATAMVAPMIYGAGIQNKVLEGMATATPVVCTPQAVAALQATNGEHLLVAEEPVAFAQTALRLLDDADLRVRLGQAGRRYVEGHHDWEGIAARLEEVFLDVKRDGGVN